MEIRDRIDAEIYKTGAALIDSDFFQSSKNQIHHGRTTLYDHVIDVARVAVRLCNECSLRQKKVDRRSVILAALCHDLGMIGRDEKYANNSEACRIHPIESARLAKEYFPDISETALSAIRKHMWPLVPTMPTTREEWLVIRADKKASIDDYVPGCFIKAFYKKG